MLSLKGYVYPYLIYILTYPFAMYGIGEIVLFDLNCLIDIKEGGGIDMAFQFYFQSQAQDQN